MTLPKGPIAYFSLEFGIDSNIPTYAGGLGILAADTLLQAADDNLPMVGIGMMYKGKRFIQKISQDGMQYEEPTPFRLEGSSCFRRVDQGGKPVRFSIRVASEEVWVEAHQQRLGDYTTLYLLTTDVEGNSEYWRNLFDEIYWGNDEEQIKERIVFGIGGMKLLSTLKIKPSLIHIQEGRPCFVALPVMADIKSKKPNLTFDELLAETKKQIVYTNHTLVAAGNHSYERTLMEKYVIPASESLGLDGTKLIELGLLEDGRFHTTDFAISISKISSSVSTPHGKLAKKQYPKANWVNITNGVYLPRWQQPEIASTVTTNKELWEIHAQKKHSLAREVESRIGLSFNPNWLTVTWARRVSGYKQLGLIFGDIARLASIIKNSERPINLLIAGKAHPGDIAGKELIRSIIENMKGPLSGNALFIHNYDIALAQALVAGSDIWLNTPEVGKEASGTSGMKAISNGVLNVTVPDGWAAEVEWSDIGWVIDSKNVMESVYGLLEKEIAPLFYRRDGEDVPNEWVERMRKSILLSDKYSTKRMLGEYIKKLYSI